MRLVKSCLIISYACALILTTKANAQQKNDWKPLAESYSVNDLKTIITSREKWQPYPNINNAAEFDKIPDAVKEAYIHKGEQLLDVQWPPLPAAVFLQFVRTGNRSNYEKLSFQRREQLADLVLAEAFERKGRFIDQIVNGIWAICEESFWGVPAHMGLQKAGTGLPDVQDPVVDLFAAETAQEMAWTYYLLKPELDKVNPLITKRIEYETTRRVLKPYLEHEDWGYMGFQWKKNPDESRRVNNWNPWINSNVLAATLVLAKDADFRLQLIHKTMESIDNFVIPYPADGGSDEGPEYWGRAAGSLLDYLELLKSASGGKIDVFNEQVIKNMGKYCYRMDISYPYYINYGDADAIYKPDPALLYRFGTNTSDSLLMHFAAFEAQQQQFGDGTLDYPFGVLNRALPALLAIQHINYIQVEEPLVRDVWLPDIQVMAARSEAGSTDGFYIAAKGGTNGASHNHNDVGNYIVYYNGRPVLVDAGAQTYTAQTFSSRRYELWNNQSAYHNLPDINGVQQHEGFNYAATGVSYKEDNKSASLEINIEKAYPEKAAVKSWKRTMTLNRGKDVEITENYQLDKYIAPITENFLTPLSANTDNPGNVQLTDTSANKKYQIHYDPKLFQPVIDTIKINDGQPVKNANQEITRNGRMYRIWGSTLYRVRLISRAKRLKDHFTISIH